MAVVEKSRNKRLYKATLVLLKVIPMLLSLFYVLNTTLYIFGIDLHILSYIAGVSLLPLIFLYLTSFAFGFCKYHRMFLHYIVLNDLINIADYYIEGLFTDRSYIITHIVVLGIALFVILYLYKRKI